MAPLNQPGNSAEPLASGAIDLAAALTLLGGNHALYEQVAQSFLDEIQTLPARLEPMLRAVDLNEAARTLHTLKGLSLTVGAVHLGESCRKSELEIKAVLGSAGGLDENSQNRIGTRVSESVASTTRTMKAALAGLNPAQDSSAQASEDAAALSASQDLIADLKNLESLLIQSDMRAIDVHKQLWRVHGAAAQGRLDGLNAALHSFDFERGVVQCGVLIREFSDSNK
jgi:HPt (histidine-containing phosphotransfer) domain-containing protein